VACSLVAVHTFAKDAQPGILGNDDRKTIDQVSAPWAAIGQVNVTGYRYLTRCTGSLIAPNLVITAAHCVMDPWRREPFPAQQIHLLGGVRRSGWLGHSTAKCLHFPAEYAYVGPEKILPSLPIQKVPQHAFLRDVVLIVLKEELDNVLPLEIDYQT